MDSNLLQTLNNLQPFVNETGDTSNVSHLVTNYLEFYNKYTLRKDQLVNIRKEMSEMSIDIQVQKSKECEVLENEIKELLNKEELKTNRQSALNKLESNLQTINQSSNNNTINPLLEKFMQVTNSDLNTATTYLMKSGNNLEVAINEFYSNSNINKVSSNQIIMGATPQPNFEALKSNMTLVIVKMNIFYGNAMS